MTPDFSNCSVQRTSVLDTVYVFITCHTKHIEEYYNHVPIDMRFFIWCILLIMFGVLIGLYYHGRCCDCIPPLQQQQDVQPQRMEQIHWDTHCGICKESYEDVYQRDRTKLSVVVLIPCRHTLCTVCFEHLQHYQSSSLDEQLKCFLCRCNVMFPIQHKIESSFGSRQ